jgi:PIN domain nuclease of toxin-antitoxin system
MKVLLDTHILLWAASNPSKLSKNTRTLLNSEENELLFSAASLWEITIKNQLGRDDFQVDPRLFRRALLDNGYLELPITSEHAITVDILPPIHKDPFDRLLIAQSIIEEITLLTADPLIINYPGSIQRA